MQLRHFILGGIVLASVGYGIKKLVDHETYEYSYSDDDDSDNLENKKWLKEFFELGNEITGKQAEFIYHSIVSTSYNDFCSKPIQGSFHEKDFTTLKNEDEYTNTKKSIQKFTKIYEKTNKYINENKHRLNSLSNLKDGRLNIDTFIMGINKSKTYDNFNDDDKNFIEHFSKLYHAIVSTKKTPLLDYQGAISLDAKKAFKALESIVNKESREVL